MAISFSLKEAAAITDVSERAVRKEVEARTIRPRIVSVGHTRRYRFGTHDLLYLKLIAGFPLPLRHADKRSLRDIVEGKQWSSGRWHCDKNSVIIESDDLELRVDLRRLRDTLTSQLRIYLRVRRRIVSNPAVLGGEPVFEGTRIPLSHVAALMAKKVPIEEIEEDYPSLGPDDLRYAAMVARMRSNPGRPRKPLVLIHEGRQVVTDDQAVGAGESSPR